MNRIPYLPADLAEPRDVVQAIRTRRGGALIELDRMLLHSPPFAMGWNSFMGAVRNELELPAKLRELAMCLVAVLNGAEYERVQHTPLFLAAGGTPEQAQALLDPAAAAANHHLFDDTERAAINFTIELTRQVHLSDATFAAMRRQLPNDRQLVELVGVIASYNMVSRFLVALGIEPH